MTDTILQENLQSIRRRIRDAAGRVERDPEEVTLVVVTKSVDASLIGPLRALGVTDVGENRVGALVERRRGNESLRWHMIGHLQRRQASGAVEAADLIHSVDSVRLAERIDRLAAEAGRRGPVEILAQVNVSGEAAKDGLEPAELPGFLERAALLERVRVAGLMTMAPLAEDPEAARPVFSRLAEMAREARQAFGDDVLGRDLSMGMSQDFEVAIEEGATLVRVGSAVFEGMEVL